MTSGTTTLAVVPLGITTGEITCMPFSAKLRLMISPASFSDAVRASISVPTDTPPSRAATKSYGLSAKPLPSAGDCAGELSHGLPDDLAHVAALPYRLGRGHRGLHGFSWPGHQTSG